MKHSIKYILLLTVLAGAGSCKKYLDEKVISNISYSHYQTPEGIESGVAATYNSMRYFFENESSPSVAELGTDMYTDGRDAEFRTQLNRYEATLNSTFGANYNYWSNLYSGITRANYIMDAIGKIEGKMPDETKSLRIGELSFLRAYYYFILVQAYGAVPLVLEAETEINTAFKRSPIPEVYNQVIKDLQFAIATLPPTQPQYGRVTRGAAQHALAMVYLTRASAVVEQRGQQPTDLDSAAYYADEVINSGQYQLVPDFKDLWPMANQKNREVIFSAQFSATQLLNNNSGNRTHLFFGMTYDLKPGMTRSLQYGRPWNRIIPTRFAILDLYDRKNDSRFYKSYRTVWFANNPNNLPKWEPKGGFVPPADLLGKNKINVGDTSIWVTAEQYPQGTNLDSLYASRPYYYMPMNRQDNANFFVLLKHLDPTRIGFNDEIGFRDGVIFRLGETYLIAAEAYGRKGDFATAADRLNVIRTRAAYKDGEEKPGEYWTTEEGLYEDRLTSTEPVMLVTAADLAAKPSFTDFILDERGRELNGEFKRKWDLNRMEKLVERVQLHNPTGGANVRSYHRYLPIPQNHIDRLDPVGTPQEEQNEGYF